MNPQPQGAAVLLNDTETIFIAVVIQTWKSVKSTSDALPPPVIVWA